MYGNITMPECSCLSVSFSSQASGPRIVDQDQPGGVHQGSSLPASPVLCLLFLSASLLSSFLLSLSFCGRRNGCDLVRRFLGRMAVGISAGWPLDSRRVAWPHLCTLGWGAGETRVAWSASYPVPDPIPVPDPQWCPMCPHPAGLRLPSWRALMVLTFHW